MKPVCKCIFIVCVALLFSASTQAAFIVEAHSSGLANENFEGSGSPSLRSYAPGTTASNSIFGGSDDYMYYYTPGTDVDNYFPAEGADLTNGHTSSGMTGGAPGYYNVYITWPASPNPDPAGCKITVSSEDEDVVDDPVDMRNGGTGSPGGNDGWYMIGERIRLITGNTYTVHQLANSQTYVSQRSHGVMWELVEPLPPLADIVETDESTGVTEGSDQADKLLISLAAQPPQAIVLNGTVSEPNQILLDDQASAKLVFTPENWNQQQTLEIKSVDDLFVEGDHKVMILFMTDLADPNSDPNSSYIGGFGGLTIVNITDNEVPDVRVTESGSQTIVSEQGDLIDTYTIRLLYPPTDNVTVSIATDGENQVLVDTGSGASDLAELVFTPGNWDIEQTVTVTAVDDDQFEGVANHRSTISHAVSSLDGGYDGLPVRDVLVLIEDNECGTWGFSFMDFDKNCVVGLNDFALFAESWLTCTQPYGDGCIDLN